MLKIKKMSKVYNKNTENEIRVFDNFNLTIEKYKCTSIIGSNGSGKSTLLNIISGEVKLDSGEILLDNIDITNLKEEKRLLDISKVYQDPSKGVSPSLTILENLSLADKKGEKFKLKRLVRKNRINYYKDLLKSIDIGLENIINTKVKFLSGGQRQCLSLIMASMKKPKLLLLDEHTAALDPKTSKIILEKTKLFLKKKNITTIMISHNMKDAIHYSDRVIMLKQGKLILDEKSSNLSEKDLLYIY